MEHIKLPEPQKELEFPLMKALEIRRTTRKWTITPCLKAGNIKSIVGGLRHHEN
ncbi:MAG: hypothetical protein JEZ04_18130 [Spirochaetales bacterium]|nr:hypothetical protein [Spirochaetales bacterium]